MTKFRQHHTRSAKITPETVILIRQRYHKDRASQGQLAREFDLSVVQIGRIVRNESWRHLPTLEEPDPIKLAHAETVELPKELQEKLMAELGALEEPQSKTDPIDEYLKTRGGSKDES